MSGSTKKDEGALARERNERLQKALARKRAMSVALAVIFAVPALVACTTGLEMTGFCLFVVSLILLLRYFEANSHLHEVRRRFTKSLVPHLSLLQRENGTAELGQSRVAGEK